LMIGGVVAHNHEQRKF